MDDDTPGGAALREGDKMLGDIFADACYDQLITKSEWVAANRCRLSLQVLSVADITTGDGKEIDPKVKKGIKQEGSARNVQWPYQGQPSKVDWQVWRRVLKLTVCNGHQHSLHHRLGAWIEPYASSSLPNWRWFWDASINNL
jgi:hypothetical protein